MEKLITISLLSVICLGCASAHKSKQINFDNIVNNTKIHQEITSKESGKMKKETLGMILIAGILLCYTTTAAAGLIDYERRNKRRGIKTINGVVEKIDQRNNEIVIKETSTLTEHKFTVDADVISKLSKGKIVDVAFHSASNNVEWVHVKE